MAVAIGVLGEVATQALWLAATLMAVGVWLHLTEHHAIFTRTTPRPMNTATRMTSTTSTLTTW